MKYFILVIYEDGTRYEALITNKKDFQSIPKDKHYEAIRIFYDDKVYSHFISGNDRVYLDYKKGCIVKAQWDNDQTSVDVIELKGVGKETVKHVPVNKIKPNFIGELIDDNAYDEIIKECERWNP